jgi:hypothetical protein
MAVAYVLLVMKGLLLVSASACDASLVHGSAVVR